MSLIHFSFFSSIIRFKSTCVSYPWIDNFVKCSLSNSILSSKLVTTQGLKISDYSIYYYKALLLFAYYIIFSLKFANSFGILKYLSNCILWYSIMLGVSGWSPILNPFSPIFLCNKQSLMFDLTCKTIWIIAI